MTILEQVIDVSVVSEEHIRDCQKYLESHTEEERRDREEVYFVSRESARIETATGKLGSQYHCGIVARYQGAPSRRA